MVGVGTRVLDIPAFRLLLSASDGSSIQLSDLVGVSPVVLFFYPKASSSGCTKQVCQFRNNYDKIVKKAKVFGVSGDSLTAQDKFSQEQKLPYLLLSDNKGRLRDGFDVKKNFFVLPGRQTFVINKEGVIILSYNSSSPDGHVEKALEALESC